MLSTPPAFILSQDRTLMFKFSPGQSCANAFLSVLFLSELYCFLGCSTVPLVRANCFTTFCSEISLASSLSRFGFLRNLQGWLYCSIIKVLFHLLSTSGTHSRRLLTACLLYHIALHLSSTFFNFFNSSFLSVLNCLYF